jgi:DNA gyrase subunit A
MKLEEGDALIGVATCHEGDDVLLATRRGRAIRFQILDETLRVFASRGSDGVRGIRLQGDDTVISLAVLRHVDLSNEEREAYLKAAGQKRRAAGEEIDAEAEEAAIPELAEDGEGEPMAAEVTLSPERFEALEAGEEFLLVVNDHGLGFRTSAYWYPVKGRGGLGNLSMDLKPRAGRAGQAEVIATFTVTAGDDVMLVTDGGQLIRSPVAQVRMTRRSTKGVILLRPSEGERVTSCFRVVDDAEEAAEEEETASDA